MTTIATVPGPPMSAICEYANMRTTIDLPDELLRTARVRAAEADETLKELFARALRNELGRTPRKSRRELPLVKSRRPGASQLTADQLDQALAMDESDSVS